MEPGRGRQAELDNQRRFVPRLGYLIKRVELGLRTQLDERLRELGLTVHQYAILGVLRRVDGLSSADMARFMRVTPQAMNQLVAGLERRELVVRSPDPHHRKILRLALGENAEPVLKTCDDVVDSTEEAMVADLDEQERQVLVRALRKCADALNMLDIPGAQDAPASEPVGSPES